MPDASLATAIPTVRVTAVTVTYGARWHLAKQVVDAVLTDARVTNCIIVDNGTSEPEAIDHYALVHGTQVTIVRHDRNIGYSAAIADALARARETDCEYVLVLDDDNVLEKGAIEMFLQNLKTLPDPERAVLSANRIDVADSNEVFRRPVARDLSPKGTIFEVFSIEKFRNLVRLLLRRPKVSNVPFRPIVPVSSLVTGGSFIPIAAVRETPLPDASLFIYGEDLEYSWRMRRLGYSMYACARPIMHDIDLTFTKEGDHLFDLFDPAFPAFKVYLRLRNAIIISRRNTIQSPFVLLLNVLVWFAGLLGIGLFTLRLTRDFFARARVILFALKDGYSEDRTIPSFIQTPT